MSLAADTLLDRVRLKRQLSRWRLIAIAIAVIAALLYVEKDSKYSPIKSDYIARIPIDFIVTDDRELSKLIETVGTDDHAKAVLVWLDTPGGSAVGGQQLYLDLLKVSKSKPVVAVMRSTATSAGYMAALGADHIVAREGTITGSIGVIMEAFEATELAQKIGIRPITIKSGPNKAAPSPIEKFTPAQEAVIQAVIKDFFNWFVDIVAERRGMTHAEVEALADGRIYTGRQALKAGLIDELGGEDRALAWLEKTRKIDPTLEIRDIKLDKDSAGILEQIFGLSNGKIASAVWGHGSGLSAIWQPNAL